MISSSTKKISYAYHLRIVAKLNKEMWEQYYKAKEANRLVLHWESQSNHYQEEFNRKNGLSGSMVSLLLGYMHLHKICACELCVAAMRTLEIYGFRVMTKDKADKRIYE